VTLIRTNIVIPFQVKGFKLVRFLVLNLFHVKIHNTFFFVSSVNERYFWQTEEREMTVW